MGMDDARVSVSYYNSHPRRNDGKRWDRWGAAVTGTSINFHCRLSLFLSLLFSVIWRSYTTGERQRNRDGGKCTRTHGH